MSGKDIDLIWKEVVERINEKMGNSRAVEIWIKPVKPVSFFDNILTIQIPNPTFEKGFSSFLPLIKETFKEVEGSYPEIKLTLQEEKEVKIFGTPLNPDYTFENFVIGQCNRLAHAAALAVAQSPGTAYNPLFLYGGVGLGKTHLMQAIGHFVMKKHNIKVAYMPSEVFVNQFIQSIQNRTTQQFRNLFRTLDFLLLDDIHFIGGKGGSQEEFFHTFNILYDKRKQIILSSDRPPKEIKELEERLVSRFEWGLVVDLQPPDFETRVAILKKKCEIKKFYLDDKIIFYIAENIKDNIRLLEGVLNRLMAYSSLLNREIDKRLVDEVIESICYKERKQITIDLIIEKVSEFFHISPSDLKSTKRIKNIVIPRQIAMYLARELTGSSLNSIAFELGGRDHTTVIHAYKKVKKMIDEDEYIRDTIERIKRKIGG